MPRYTIEGSDVDAHVLDADNWMSALADALEILGISGDAASGVECDVRPNGDIAVRTQNGDFTIREITDTVARIRISPDRSVLVPEADRPTQAVLGAWPIENTIPGSAALDAPDPTSSSAYRARVDSSETVLREIHGRATALQDAVDITSACNTALDLLMEYIPAESGSVLLVVRPTRDLQFVAARGPRATGLLGKSVPAGRGIAGLAVRAGVAMTVREASTDPRHFSELDRRTGYHTSAILSVPIRMSDDTLGCIELLNPFAGTEFATWHQSATSLVASRLAGRLLRG